MNSSDKYIHISINNYCNYNCNYCMLLDKKTQRIDLDLIKTYSFLCYIKKYTDFNVLISGYGEPTLHPYLLQFVSLLKRSDFNVQLLTNGSQSTSYYEKLLKLKCNISFSYHSLQNDTMNQQFVDKLKFLYNTYDTIMCTIVDDQYASQKLNEVKFMKNIYLLKMNSIHMPKQTVSEYFKKRKFYNEQYKNQLMFVQHTGNIFRCDIQEFLTDNIEIANLNNYKSTLSLMTIKKLQQF